MTDISMCADGSCPSRMKCHRFTAKPSEFRQSYMVFDRKGEDRCDSFWPNYGARETD